MCLQEKEQEIRNLKYKIDRLKSFICKSHETVDNLKEFYEINNILEER